MVRPDQAVDEWVARHSDELLDFLINLVRIPSDVQPPIGNEMACQQYIEAEYRKHSAQVDVFTPDQVPGLREHPAYFGTWDGVPRSFVNRPDIVGTFHGRGGGKSLIISAHVDTVPINPSLWKEAPPLSGLIKDGRLYGRGAWDTKWGIAAGLYAIRCIQALDIKLRGDVILESVVDEEFAGSHGTLAACLQGYQADVAINCEPTNMVVAPAHHGGTAWRITIKGDSGMDFHGMEMENSVYKLTRVIEAVRAFDRERNAKNKPALFFDTNPNLKAYTLQVGGGGTSYAEAEGLPSSCYLIVWVEEFPGTDFEAHRSNFIGFINRFLELDPEYIGSAPEYSQLIRYIPGSSIDTLHPIFDHLGNAYRSAGRQLIVAGAPLACDTYIFNLYSNTPAITLGPRGGNAHSGDEYVLVKDVIDLTRIFSRLLLSWCG